jgi:hypothetical protein
VRQLPSSGCAIIRGMYGDLLGRAHSKKTAPDKQELPSSLVDARVSFVRGRKDHFGVASQPFNHLSGPGNAGVAFRQQIESLRTRSGLHRSSDCSGV